jgi:hypothetical protein
VWKVERGKTIPSVVFVIIVSESYFISSLKKGKEDGQRGWDELTREMVSKNIRLYTVTLNTVERLAEVGVEGVLGEVGVCGQKGIDFKVED